jgi:hypothetical protein
MQYNLEIRSLATIEILEAYDWYESQKAELGLEFLNDLELFYNALFSNPFAHSYYKEPIRQGSLSKFPYVVVYEVFNKTIVVYSVFMTSRDPKSKSE